MSTDGQAVRWRDFPSGPVLAESLALDVAAVLEGAIAACGSASLAVSGGSTPGPFLDALSRRPLDWAKVVVTLVDERFVPPTSDRSNERLVRGRLLTSEARLARFLPLFHEAASARESASLAEAGLALLGPRLDAVVLGMGADAHTASLFPDAPDLDALTDPRQPRRVLSVDAPSAGEPRLTLTLPPITGATFLALHIEGREKRDALERALATPDPRPPIARVLDAAPHAKVYWAP